MGIRKDQIDDQMNKIEGKSVISNGIIKDLVASFLIPNVKREQIIKRGKV